MISHSPQPSNLNARSFRNSVLTHSVSEQVEPSLETTAFAFTVQFLSPPGIRKLGSEFPIVGFLSDNR